ncbi:MAG: helix-turn-helix transcriptional regulator [Micropruina sp.]|nr:helix-turn-helix transcriptional regulator [Micropruina sp.]
MIAAEAVRPLLMRELLGESLRELRTADQRTLREVSSAARVSLGYLSEIERGQKEPSSELLNAICGALGVPLSSVLRRVSDKYDDRDVLAHLPVRSARAAA